MVRLHNVTQKVDNFLCEDAGLSVPEITEICGGEECPHWVTDDWKPCVQSQCVAKNKAIQNRNVQCKFSNGTDSISCDDSERPLSRQECYNERCKPIWRVGEWSEVNIHLLNCKFFVTHFIYFSGTKSLL